MSNFNLKPASAAVKKYYATLERFARGHFDKEGNIRGAFEDLLKHCARQYGWTLVPEYSIPRKDRNPASIDGALLDAFNIPRGYWEAKDEKDSLRAEMDKKFAVGYPRSNILFQRPTEALLFQDGRIAFQGAIEDPQKLIDVLSLFFEWRQPEHDTWDRAVTEFSQRIPEIAKGAMALIEAERKKKGEFVQRFAAFADLCRESINPDLKDESVEEMLVQHLLTERIFRRIFDNPEFTRRNVIAAEIEKVIGALTSRHFSRDAFLRDLDPFYKAIEQAASTVEDYSEKQRFLNTVYERFFQGFNRKQADTHGIVYTPQPIVDFMVRSVEEILKSEFGRSLSDKDVHILDPFVGTGNFILRVMHEIKTSRLPQKYKEELHCNEVMLLPYYIASMNIEHAYYDRTEEYEPFEGICLVDTFEVRRQIGSLGEENARRIAKQNSHQIFVVIGNPPYNAWQENEDDNNKNRKYPVLDKLLIDSYVKPSQAVNKNSLWDMYVRSYRWASDRIGAEGIVAFVSNNGFVDGLAFDGMRKSLAATFTEIFHFNLKGNARTSGDRRQREGGNIFNDAIRVGIGITLLVKRNVPNKRPAKIHIYDIADYLTRSEKEQELCSLGNCGTVPWKILEPERGADWFESSSGTERLIDIESLKSPETGVFGVHSNGIKSNRDAWVYNYSPSTLGNNIKRTIDFYNSERNRWEASDKKDLDSFVSYDTSRISWSRDLKQDLIDGHRLAFNPQRLRQALYRPFCKMHLYFDPTLNEEIYSIPKLSGPNLQNRYIVLTGPGSEKPFMALATNYIPDLHLVGAASTGQCFALTAVDDNQQPCDNITDWALSEFRSHYGQKSIAKLEIFHYVYALLHHPEYRTRYAANLKRELPRIPFAPDFAEYARIGAELMKLHIDYEKQPEYNLARTETGKLNWRVEKMALSKDKTQLRYNEFLSLSGIPPEVYEYRLGNRSALEWVVDQYRVSTDKRSGIVNDPNREDDSEYIVRLIGQVVTVSLETVKLVRELSALPLLPQSGSPAVP